MKLKKHHLKQQELYFQMIFVIQKNLNIKHTEEEQKKNYLPKIIDLELLGGWGLTEDKIGSDASNMNTNVTKTQEGYKINGVKRWIGSGNKDLLVTWAKNTETKNVEAFILEKGVKGWNSEVIKNKLALRVV